MSFAPLSDVAFRIVTVAPPRFREGNPYSCRQLAMLTGYSRNQVQRGLVELAIKGYCVTIPYAKNNRVQYAGNPFVLTPAFAPTLAKRTRQRKAA